jgi:hypothetical protein
MRDNGDRPWRLFVRFHANIDGEEREAILRWAAGELMPAILPALRTAPVQVSLSFEALEGGGP